MRPHTLLFLWASFAACAPAASTDQVKTESSPLDACSALLGTWNDTSDTAVLFTETWRPMDDSTLTGAGVGKRGTDTPFAEALRLEERDGQINYIATAFGQNDDKPVAFRATHLSADSLVFENPAHDFPQRISYRKAHNGWDVVVSAVINDSTIARTFRLRK